MNCSKTIILVGLFLGLYDFYRKDCVVCGWFWLVIGLYLCMGLLRGSVIYPSI